MSRWTSTSKRVWPLYTAWLSRDELTLPTAQIKSADMVWNKIAIVHLVIVADDVLQSEEMQNEAIDVGQFTPYMCG
jgi:hypothetical protein